MSISGFFRYFKIYPNKKEKFSPLFLAQLPKIFIYCLRDKLHETTDITKTGIARKDSSYWMHSKNTS